MQIDHQGQATNASSSREPSPTNSSSEQGPAASLADVLLDVIWAVDGEIDLRKELAVGAGQTVLLDGAQGKSAEGSVEQQAKAAKSNLTDIVRELLVSDAEGKKRRMPLINDFADLSM